jgi:hypothetical protein
MRPTPPLVFNTFSIVAHDLASGMFGVGASTKLPAVGTLVPYARCGVGAIATQARTNPLLGYDGLDLLQRGYGAGETLKILLGSDPEPEKRQVGTVDSWGHSAAHTGPEADPWRRHVVGEGYAVMGNLVVGEEVVVAMAEAFEASVSEPLPERLMRALEAGQAAGGDKRGKQSAAIYTVKDQPYPYIRPAGGRAYGPRGRATADLRSGQGTNAALYRSPTHEKEPKGRPWGGDPGHPDTRWRLNPSEWEGARRYTLTAKPPGYLARPLRLREE